MSKTEKALFGIILFVIDFVITGFTTIYLWNNIICQLFQIRTLTFWQGWIFSFAIAYFLPHTRSKDDDLVYKLLCDTIYTLLVWFIGFLAVRFIPM